MIKFWVNICFYYSEERLNRFYKVIKNLINIPHIKIIINSNINFDTNLPIHTANLQDPYMHTWEHKKYLLEFLKSDYTHFGYLEGNIEIKKKTIDYWVATRELFKKNNLNFIPAVHRIQKRGNEIFSLDCTHHQGGRPIIEVSGQKFISLSEPYQGMFIMDKKLAEEHIKSDYFSAGLKKSFLIRESANLGNMFVNIPKGFDHRHMLSLTNFSDTWVEHFGADYHGDVKSPHSKIKISHLFSKKN